MWSQGTGERGLGSGEDSRGGGIWTFLARPDGSRRVSGQARQCGQPGGRGRREEGCAEPRVPARAAGLGAGCGAVRIWDCRGPHSGISGLSRGVSQASAATAATCSVLGDSPPPSGVFRRRPPTRSRSSRGAGRPGARPRDPWRPTGTCGAGCRAPSPRAKGRGAGSAAPRLLPGTGAPCSVGFPRKGQILRLGFPAFAPAVYTPRGVIYRQE